MVVAFGGMKPAAEIHGDRSLPPGFRHPHASEEARAVADAGMILRVQVGSGVHGTSISGQDDRDEMGICLEPARFVTGLARVPRGIDGGSAEVEFEQYHRHTVWDMPGGLANRSGAGDLDIVIYSARKWCRLALAGNPTLLLALFVPDEDVVYRNAVGAELVDNAHRFVSKLAAGRILGYLQSQRAAMTAGRGHIPTDPSWSRCTATTRSSRCTRCAWASKGSSSCAQAGSPFRCPSQISAICARSGGVRLRWTK